MTIELRKLGHEAYSCDIEPCSGGHPEWHIKDDVLKYINGALGGGGATETENGDLCIIPPRWDMIIAFPPCTYLSNAGAVRLRVNGEIQEERMEKARAAKAFFMAIYNADCEKVAIENPVPGKIHGLPPYNQIIQPYMFGDPWLKKTCLWLRGVPPLFATEICVPEGLWVETTKHGRAAEPGAWERKGQRSAKMRSKTFPGVARAMAQQWTGEGVIWGTPQPTT